MSGSTLTLRRHLHKYGYYKRHGKVRHVYVGHNLLDEPRFRIVEFEDGYVVSLFQREKLPYAWASKFSEWMRVDSMTRPQYKRFKKKYGYK
jgi:hypothetical protein